MKKFLWFLAGVCALAVAGIAFTVLFADNLIDFSEVKTARVGQSEVVLFSECDFSGDCMHKLGVRSAKAPLISKWWESSDLKELPAVFVSRDGSLVAVQSEQFDTGTLKSLGQFFRAYHDLPNKRTGAATQTRPFSRQTEAMLAARGGKVPLAMTTRHMGMWKWQDRDYKDFGVS